MAARCGLSEEQTLSPPLSSHIPHESARLCLNHSISPPAQYSLSQHVKLLLPTATWKGPCHAHPRDTRMGALGLVALSGPSRSPPLQAGKRQRRPLCLQCCRAEQGSPSRAPMGHSRGLTPGSAISAAISNPCSSSAPVVVPSATCTEALSDCCFEIHNRGVVPF